MLREVLKNEIGIYGKIPSYHFKLKKDYRLDVQIKPEYSINTEFIVLESNGTLIIRSGYDWYFFDIISIDFSGAIPAGLVINALNQLSLQKLINYETYEV